MYKHYLAFYAGKNLNSKVWDVEYVIKINKLWSVIFASIGF